MMNALNEGRLFCTAYESPSDFAWDCSYIITDLLYSLWSFTQHLALSLPLIAGLLSFNIPLMLFLSFPVAMGFFTLNVPILIAAIVFAAPSIYSFALTLYDALDCALSPVISIMRIMSNLTATLVESVECTLVANEFSVF